MRFWDIHRIKSRHYLRVQLISITLSSVMRKALEKSYRSTSWISVNSGDSVKYSTHRIYKRFNDINQTKFTLILHDFN